MHAEWQNNIGLLTCSTVQSRVFCYTSARVPITWSVHVALFKQGLLAHSFMSLKIKQRKLSLNQKAFANQVQLNYSLWNIMYRVKCYCESGAQRNRAGERDEVGLFNDIRLLKAITGYASWLMAAAWKAVFGHTFWQKAKRPLCDWVNGPKHQVKNSSECLKGVFYTPNFKRTLYGFW